MTKPPASPPEDLPEVVEEPGLPTAEDQLEAGLQWVARHPLATLGLVLLAIPAVLAGGVAIMAGMVLAAPVLGWLLALASPLLFLAGGAFVLWISYLGISGGLPEGDGWLRWLWEGESRSRALEARAAPGEVEFLPAPPGLPEVSPDAHCPFCGQPLGDLAAVRCATCEAPHHEDCWLQAQRCSVYACGSARATRAT